MRTHHVYVMASRSRLLYVGVTNDLPRRLEEHKRGLTPGFTSGYRITRLVYFEEFGDIRDAIARSARTRAQRRIYRVVVIVRLRYSTGP
jgi:putative endonuclease